MEYRTLLNSLIVFVLITGIHSTLITDINEAKRFLREFDYLAAEMQYQAALVDWAYSTNITDYNRERQVIFLCPNYKR